MHTKLLTCFLAAMLLLLAACSSNQVVTSLELTIDAVSSALPLVGPAAGLPPDIQAAVQTYLGATSEAVGKAAVILDGPGTDAQKAAAITSAFAGIAAPIVPAKYQQIATAVQNVAELVAKFLSHATSASIESGPAVRGASAFAPEPSKKGTTKLSAKDRKRLAEIKARAEAAKQAAKKQ